jgi:putative ABC transport system substrate-binding protein
MWRIGYLARGTPNKPGGEIDAFVAELGRLGYVEGQNLLIEFRFAEGRLEAYPVLAQELERLKVDVIVAPNTPAALAAKAATNSIPIVFMAVSDLVGSGLVASLPHPGGNITGTTDIGVDLVGKQLDLLKQMVPNLKRVAALGHSTDTVWEPTWRQAQEAARQLHIEILPVLVTTPAQLESAFAGLERRVQALFVAPQIFFAVHVRRVAELLALARLPAMYQARLFADAGGLMSYGPNYRIVFSNTARYVDKILNGARPADLPVEQPTEYELVINLKTAKSLGLTIPESVLLHANEVIR